MSKQILSIDVQLGSKLTPGSKLISYYTYINKPDYFSANRIKLIVADLEEHCEGYFWVGYMQAWFELPIDATYFTLKYVKANK